MKGYIEIEKPTHCLKCWLRNDDDYCVVQRDGANEFIEYDSWEQQMANCPIKIKDRCGKAIKTNDGKCKGYQRSRWDDEPVESCKECQDFELFGVE